MAGVNKDTNASLQQEGLKLAEIASHFVDPFPGNELVSGGHAMDAFSLAFNESPRV